jgi:hypothetical protein
MEYDDIPEDDCIVITQKWLAEQSLKTDEAYEQLDKIWGAYSNATKIAMWTQCLCIITKIYGDMCVENKMEYTSIALVAQLATEINRFLGKKEVVKIYEESLVPDVDELKRIMEL